MTPKNAASERERLVRELRAGVLTLPKWSYARATTSDAATTVLTAASELRRTSLSPLAALYAARLQEISTEQALIAAVGTHWFGELARARFAPSTAAAAYEALNLAHLWLGEGPLPRSAYTSALASDAPDPRSLVSRMRAEVGRRRLPFRVVVDDALGSLAATGERTIFVAKGRPADDEDVARTVLHEVAAHAVPRARAAELTPGIFALGTARGTDEQEGLALVLEERHGFLTPRRRRELAARHLAVAWMHAGATFVDVATKLCGDHAFSPDEAIRICERAFRGDDGTRCGLGRERVYLESFVRVRAWLEDAPEDEGVLTSGQVALEAVDALRPLAHPARSSERN
jgi:hypothetical protein